MARRVSWTNNSSGHTGAYIYRAPTLDPQNLPAPVATVDPVAQGETAEWIDLETLAAGDYDYSVQDFDGQGVGQLSSVVAHNVPVTLSSAQAGDYVGGGVYVGTITYPDSRQFHIIFSLESDEATGLIWGNDGRTTNANDGYDGLANQERILASYDYGDAEAFYYCRDYIDASGNSDYYLPAVNEFLLYKPLYDSNHPEFNTDIFGERWTSTENNYAGALRRSYTDTNTYAGAKNSTSTRVRPVRRVPV